MRLTWKRFAVVRWKGGTPVFFDFFVVFGVSNCVLRV
jgi:hypothetical protein